MPSTSQAQQGFMGMVHAYKSGKLKADDIPQGVRRRVLEASKSMSDDDARHFAETPRSGLPKRASAVGPVRHSTKLRRTYSA